MRPAINGGEAQLDGVTWERDDEHMPFALAPLAADYVRAIGAGFGGWERKYTGGAFGDFRQAYWYEVVDGYAYIGHRADIPADASDVDERRRALARARAEVTSQWWNEEALPELARLYERIAAVPVEGGNHTEVTVGWTAAWKAFEATQEIHFESTLGPMQVLDDLSELYRATVSGSTAIDADRLTYGVAHEFIQAELGVERLATLLAVSPDLADAVRRGERSLAQLQSLPGGIPFEQAFDAFLAQHGHLGQSADDLSLASWVEVPQRLVAELAKRLDQTFESAARRVERQASEARDLADQARLGLAGDPDALEKFEHLLALGREIGPLMQVHNYWIDRKAQSYMRRLSLRVGRRLVDGGVISAPEDVLYLHRDEVAVLIEEPADRQALVASRREIHVRQLATTPPRHLGALPLEPDRTASDRGPDEAVQPVILQGSGASAGIVAGPARITGSSDEFDRIKPGDIIVCRSSNPSWVPLFTIAAGLVTEVGGILAHAAVVAREFGLPAVVGVAGATVAIRDGQRIEIDGLSGTVRLL